jgi:hypothetical protein
VTPSVSSKGPPFASADSKELAETPANACTNACTSTAANANAGTVEALAAALRSLSPADRARLAALLSEPGEGEGGLP